MTFRQQFTLFIRSFFLQTGWNFMKYQSMGLLFAMWPFLKHLYQDDRDALPSVLSRYLATFNIQPVLASFCLGALARQEERIAQAKTLPQFNEEVSEWISLKRGLSITTASIGDRLFWGTLKPFTLILALFIWFLLGINVFEVQFISQPAVLDGFSACVVAFIVFNAAALVTKWKGIQAGYQNNDKTCFGLTKFDWNRTIYHAKRISLILVIGLILLGGYNYLRNFEVWEVPFILRGFIILFFVVITFITRRLRIPNLYLYLAALVVFNIVCFV